MVPDPDKKQEKKAPGSFDSLAAGISGKFEEIETEVEKMQEKLRQADEQAGALERRLIDGASGRPPQRG